MKDGEKGRNTLIDLAQTNKIFFLIDFWISLYMIIPFKIDRLPF